MSQKKTIYVVPAGGLRVPLPGTRECVPLTGLRVEHTGYIARRLREKSLSVVSSEAEIARLLAEAQKAANAAGASQNEDSAKKKGKAGVSAENSGGDE